MSRAARDHRYNTSEKGRARTQRHNATRLDERNERRVYVGRYYVGTAPTTEHASTLNNEARKEFHGR